VARFPRRRDPAGDRRCPLARQDEGRVALIFSKAPNPDQRPVDVEARRRGAQAAFAAESAAIAMDTPSSGRCGPSRSARAPIFDLQPDKYVGGHSDLRRRPRREKGLINSPHAAQHDRHDLRPTPTDAVAQPRTLELRMIERARMRPKVCDFLRSHPGSKESAISAFSKRAAQAESSRRHCTGRIDFLALSEGGEKEASPSSTRCRSHLRSASAAPNAGRHRRPWTHLRCDERRATRHHANSCGYNRVRGPDDLSRLRECVKRSKRPQR